MPLPTHMLRQKKKRRRTKRTDIIVFSVEIKYSAIVSGSEEQNEKHQLAIDSECWNKNKAGIRPYR